jgi:succinate dehydrogenase/fumarate reductase cytochrome b subunit
VFSSVESDLKESFLKSLKRQTGILVFTIFFFLQHLTEVVTVYPVKQMSYDMLLVIIAGSSKPLGIVIFPVLPTCSCHVMFHYCNRVDLFVIIAY